jgi:hypothetical protein
MMLELLIGTMVICIIPLALAVLGFMMSDARDNDHPIAIPKFTFTSQRREPSPGRTLPIVPFEISDGHGRATPCHPIFDQDERSILHSRFHPN